MSPLNSVRLGLQIDLPLGEHGGPVVVEFHPSTIARFAKLAGLTAAKGTVFAAVF